MNTAIVSTSNAVFFQNEANTYRYWMHRAQGIKHAVLKIQTSRKMMAEFRASAVGRQVGRMVDIFEIGGGWFEITGDATRLAVLARKFGSNINAVAAWAKAWNQVHIGTVDANPGADVETPRAYSTAPSVAMVHAAERAQLEAKAAALASKFGKRLAVV